MTRKELIRLLLLQARTNGFEFRKWYQSRISSEWTTSDAAIDNLANGGRYYALLFSHQFARHFWRPGRRMQFVVPTQEFQQVNRRGERITVVRKAYTRRTMRGNAWEYHLREMAATEEPLLYIRRFLITDEELDSQRSGKELDLDVQPPLDPPPAPAQQPDMASQKPGTGR
ncbi:MAG TPA: hypothetical protein VME86_06060 [Acidobacteriaceae bacterium]|nr:hypothetical protein [Acidobacteriaceae bacterium]